jgi:ATP-dependent Clp protease ATP-binding subunit ClpC
MNFQTTQDLDDISARARELSGSPKAPPGTGWLLLALLEGDSTAARTLTLRGLTPTQVRTALRDLEPEHPDSRSAVEARAAQVASTFGSRCPSSLHLLAALCAVRDSEAHRILAGAGLNTDVIRNQALRCLTTSLTREHGTTPGREERKIQSATASRPQAGKKPAVNPSAGCSTPAPEGRRPLHLPRGGLHVGRDLEKIQQRTRVQRTAPAAGPEPAPEPSGTALEEPPAPLIDRSDGFTLDPERFPLLAAIGRNLSAEARAGRLDDIVGREREMEQITDVLNKRRANCPCLVGPPGVGKTAVVEGLALRLERGLAPGLDGQTIIEVRPVDLLTGTSLRGALAERLSQLRQEVLAARGRVVLFFDEIHALLASNDGAEAVQELKAALGRGELPCIAATTQAEYARHVEADAALARRFTVVEAAEPTEEEAIRILDGLAPAYAAHHQVAFPSETLTAAVRLSARYVQDRALPDKAVALLDLAGARARRSGAAEVLPEDVAGVLAERLRVPAERLTSSDRQRLLDLEDELAARVVGHRHVLGAIAETLRRNAAGFRSERPIGSFLFLGPTGVGKTETAKALAELLFPGADPMVRLDMTEFSEPHAVARLLGAPPGYVGHEDGGQLTEAVRRRPYRLVLLDEIEKAHREVIQVLLQILDDGRLTDGRGRTVSLKNAVIVMTSNLGADLRELSAPRRRVGFGAADVADDVEGGPVAERILAAARGALPPELWNRIDEPLVFSPLSRDEVRDIAGLMLEGVAGQLMAEHGVELRATGAAVDALIRCGGFDPELGARPMRRTIQRLVEGPAARLVLAGEVAAGDGILVDGAEEGVVVLPERERRERET